MRKSSISIILLGLLCILSFILRFYLLPTHLFFGPEQGRDLLVVRDIVVNHKLTLIGAKTDISGIFHGPLYYYLAAIPFMLSHGNPLFISIFLVLFQVASIPFIYLLAFELTGNRRVAFLSALLMTISFQAIVYARWLSNPPLSIPFVILLFFFLVRYLRGDAKSLIWAGVAYGCLGQVEFINYALFGVLLTVVALRNIAALKNTPKQILILATFAAFLVSLGTYLLFDIRHGFLVSRSIIHLVFGSGVHANFVGVLQNIFSVFLTEGAAVFGFSAYYWGIMGLCIIIYGWLDRTVKTKYDDMVILWLGIPIITLICLRHAILIQILVALLPAWIVGISIGIERVWRKSAVIGIILLASIVVVSLESYISNIPYNERVFFQSSQTRLRYTDELAVAREVYEHADGRPFYFQAFTIPVFWQDGWTYLFWYIGTTKYHYLPVEANKADIYVIIPNIYFDPYLELFEKNWYRDTVSTWGTKTFSKKIGEFQVEERQKI